MRNNYWLFLLLLVGCKPEKEIELTLPPYTPMPVVECYLEPGRPISLVLQRTSSYFDPVSLPLIEDATIVITGPGFIDTLKAQPGLDTARNFFYNYLGSKPVPEVYNLPFNLLITTPKGEKVEGTATILDPVEPDSISWVWAEINKAYLVVSWKDDPTKQDFYRIATFDSSANYRKIRTNRILTDEFAENGKLTRGTGTRYQDGDTAFVGIWHIEKAYYDYLSSASDAANANGNPFAQPGQVKSTVKGGYGVFAGLPARFKRVVVKK